jgi:hypothetical protein
MKRQNSIAVNYTNILILLRNKWCPEADLNHRHADFQSAALPTELSGHPVQEPERQDQKLAGKGVFQCRKRARYTILEDTVQHPFCGFLHGSQESRCRHARWLSPWLVSARYQAKDDIRRRTGTWSGRQEQRQLAALRSWIPSSGAPEPEQ